MAVEGLLQAFRQRANKNLDTGRVLLEEQYGTQALKRIFANSKKGRASSNRGPPLLSLFYCCVMVLPTVAWGVL